MTNRLKVATSGGPAFASDFGSNAQPGRFLACVPGATPAHPLDTDWQVPFNPDLRRFSPNEYLYPTDFGASNLLSWYHADDLALGAVDTWNDHRFYAGSAYAPATQAVAARQPTCVNYNGEKWLNFLSASQDSKYMNLPAALGVAASGAGAGFNNFWMAANIRYYDNIKDAVLGYVSNPIVMMNIADAHGGRSLFWGTSVSDRSVLVNGSTDAVISRIGLRSAGYAPNTTWSGTQCACVMAAALSGTAIQNYISGILTQTALGIADVETCSVPVIGGGVSGHLGNFSLRELLFFSGSPTKRDLLRLEQYLLGPQKRRRIVYDTNSIGVIDSLGAGDPPYTGGSFPWYVEQSLPSTYTHDSRGMGSQATFDILNRFASETHQRLRAGDYWVFYEIGNSVFAGGSAASIIADLRAVCALVKQIGAHPLVSTCVTWGTFTAPQQAVRLAVNADILANPLLYADNVAGVVDPTSDPRLQDPTNLTYFQGDMVHLTPAGEQVLASFVTNGINALAAVYGA